MTEDHELRVKALEQAVISLKDRQMPASSQDVANAAEVFYQFLKGLGGGKGP